MKEVESKFRKRELSEIILKILGVSLLIGGSIAIPTFPFAVYTIVKTIEKLKKQRVSPKKVRRALKVLEKNDVVKFHQVNEELHVYIKNVFHPKLIRYSLEELLKAKRVRTVWDGKWFVVFFDVPEKQKNKRDQLRQLLKHIGFFQIQKSVYVFPFECKREVDLIKRITESSSYLKYMIATEIDAQETLRKYFKI